MPVRKKSNVRVEDTRSRGWLYTVNNYTDDDLADCMSLYEDDDTCSYQIIGFEKGDRNGVPHLQCYIYYKEAKSWKFMKDKLSPNHFEAQKCKLNVKAYGYSMDDLNYYEQGERPRQGHRTDLHAIKCDLLSGKETPNSLSKKYFNQWCQYRRAFNEFVDIHVKKETLLVLYDMHDAVSQLSLTPYMTGKYIICEYWHAPLVEYAKGIYDYVIVNTGTDICAHLDKVGNMVNFIKI